MDDSHGNDPRDFVSGPGPRYCTGCGDTGRLAFGDVSGKKVFCSARSAGRRCASVGGDTSRLTSSAETQPKFKPLLANFPRTSSVEGKPPAVCEPLPL